MALLVAAVRVSTRIARRRLAYDATTRGFRTTTALPAAQNFTMPALSPTMTEGNIANWRVKEGDKFIAGDVLLEIETDKATMDVEAQDDGIMMKILSGDGSKAVKVGTRIGVIAEEGDDISALEIPADEQSKQTEAKEESTSKASASENTPAESRAESSGAAEPNQPSATKPRGKSQPQKYPLLPSVAHLMKQHGIEADKVSEMTPTGPNGRLLKGDVLAYLGTVNVKVPSDISARFDKLSHLDLSNIKVAKPAPAAKKSEDKRSVPVVEESLVTLPISLARVIEVQKKIETTLGVFLPLSTFIARATDLANDELPRPNGAKMSADELFNAVLGLDQVRPQGTQGSYMPEISALPPASLLGPRSSKGKQADVIDVLSGKARPVKATAQPRRLSGPSTGMNMFSLTVPQTEAKRAKVFLDRVKVVLETEPGRLVL